MSTPQAESVSGDTFEPRIDTVAGTGAAGFAGDNESAVAAQLNRPYGAAVDSTGALDICDHRNSRIRKVAADGKFSTIAGSGVAGFKGDGARPVCRGFG